MFNFNDRRCTHMPFAAHGPDGEPEEFCCIRDGGGRWKIHHFTGKRWKRIRTGLPEDAVECSPAAEFEDGIWKISFIAGGWEGGRRFRLYRMYGIGGEVSVQSDADAGFVWKDRVCRAGRRGPVILADPERTTVLELHGVKYLYRISYNPNRPSELLISGQYENGNVFSWACNPAAGTLKSVIADGVPAYKCAFFNGICYYAAQHGGFEDRHVVRAETVEFTDLREEQYITVKTVPAGVRAGNPEFE